MFDSQGFVKACLDNPLYKNLTVAERSAIATVPAQLEFFNKRLLAHYQIKENMMKLWDIPATVSQEVHAALYAIIGEDASLLSKPAELVDVLFDLARKSSELKKSFFLPNGIIKYYGNLARAKTLPNIPTATAYYEMAKEYFDVCYMLNNLIYIELNGSRAVARHATEALNAYASHRYKLDPVVVNRRLQEALNLSINEVLREQGVKTIEEAQEKIARGK